MTIDGDSERPFETREYRRNGGPDDDGEEKKLTAPVTYVPPEFDDSEDVEMLALVSSWKRYVSAGVRTHTQFDFP